MNREKLPNPRGHPQLHPLNSHILFSHKPPRLQPEGQIREPRMLRADEASAVAAVLIMLPSRVTTRIPLAIRRIVMESTPWRTHSKISESQRT